MMKSFFAGTCFIRTDQLDGETDWKLKLAISGTQSLEHNADLFSCNATLSAEKPHNDIHSFIGSFKMVNAQKCQTVNTSTTAAATVVSICFRVQ